MHYGMSVKDGLYDMLDYSKQITEIKRSNKKDAIEEGDMIKSISLTLFQEHIYLDKYTF